MTTRSRFAEYRDRYERDVDRSGGPDGCWPWQGYIGTWGYGQMWAERATQLAHRVAWDLAVGPIPAGMSVLHRCDNRPCCNPSHLFLGTHTDNVRDMAAKERDWQSRKLHCPRGHEYNEANTYHRPSAPNERECRACNRENQRARRASRG
jgi:hypothetical protein